MYIVVNTTPIGIWARAQDSVKEIWQGKEVLAIERGKIVRFYSSPFVYILGPGWDVTSLPKGLVVIGQHPAP